MGGIERLAPWLQDYIYREKWLALRAVQAQAIDAVLDTPDHILIMSGTASGKTEAAFLPILTHLTEQPPSSIGVMYIGPLKALINDQFYRLEHLLAEGDIPVQSWHADVEASRKRAFLRRAEGILQITPESLEAMLITRTLELERLFGDLRFVVIDELHAFISSDRGRQILCQLERLERYQRVPPRRIGLSATLGDPALAQMWLQGRSVRQVRVIAPEVGGRTVELGIEHYRRADRRADDHVEDSVPMDVEPEPWADTLTNIVPEDASTSPLPIELGEDESAALFREIGRNVRARLKTLIFTNSRAQAEEVIQNLRLTSPRRPVTVDAVAADDMADRDGLFVHHGNISAALREQAELAMRAPEQAACVAATVTLELGIDLGSLDQVLQLNAANSVSSFLQRLGRTGRRGQAARMLIFTTETLPRPDAPLPQQMPWDLLQAIALLQLYHEERWIEPPPVARLPVSLLYHQTMSVLRAHTELAPADLADRVLTLSPFVHVTHDHYRALLRHLLAIEHLQQMAEGGLIIGLKAEPIVNNYRFFATFQEEMTYQVQAGGREIGSIQALPTVGDRFRLAGRSWRVVAIDAEKRRLQVEAVTGRAEQLWLGTAAPIHTRVRQRMRGVLDETMLYPYLLPRAQARLTAARQLAEHTGLTRSALLPLGGRRWLLLPWLGTRSLETLVLMLNHAGLTARLDPSGIGIQITAEDQVQIKAGVRKLRMLPPQGTALIADQPLRSLCINKFDPYIPEGLLREAYIHDRLDLPEVLNWLHISHW